MHEFVHSNGTLVPNNSYVDYNLKVVLKHSFFLQKENVESCIQYLQTIGIIAPHAKPKVSEGNACLATL